jgi:uncharacterized membrane protein
MDTLKTIIQSKFKTLSLVTTALSFSVIILMVRVKLNKSFFYLFLIWNIFLALIPYIITIYLASKPKLSKIKFMIWFLIWLAFLPNAPYIVTDLIHIRIGSDSFLWLNVIVIFSFAMTGLLLFYLSILDMQKQILLKLRHVPIDSFTIIVLFLCGFGVYLGRFLRYNSWEIISNPKILIFDMVSIIISPFQHTDAWLFTLGFGIFLIVGYWMFKTIYSSPST